MRVSRTSANSSEALVSRVEELEVKIKALSLSSHEFQELRAWLAEFDADVWDRECVRTQPRAGSTLSPIRR